MTTIVLTAAMLLACVPASADVLYLDDNGTHNLNSAVAEDNVEVYTTTTVNLLTNGSIGGYLWALDDSEVNVSGGLIGILISHESTSKSRSTEFGASLISFQQIIYVR
jgi:hypothetical protein